MNRRRIVDLALLVVAVTALVVLAAAQQRTPRSVYSSYDRGPNGLLLLYNVLAREGVEVERRTQPLTLLDNQTRTLVITSNALDAGAGVLSYVSSGERRALQTFVKTGGTIVYFDDGRDTLRLLARPAIRVRRFDVRVLTNASLARDSRPLLAVYTALYRAEPVAFEETLHGYSSGRSLWSVLPETVHDAFWLALIVVALAVIEANLPSAPLKPLAPPSRRNSLEYIVAMASLMRRARAARAIMARFARGFPEDGELASAAVRFEPTDATLVTAARRYLTLRKERS